MKHDDAPNPTDSLVQSHTKTKHHKSAAWRQFKWRMLAGMLSLAGGHPDLFRELALLVKSVSGIDVGLMEFGLPFVLAVVIGIMGARLRDEPMLIVAIALMSLGRIHFRSLSGRYNTIDTADEAIGFLIGTIPYFVALMTPALAAYWVAGRCMHRPAPGSCVVCNYNLFGNVSGKCPECGTPVDDARITRNEIAS